MAGSGVDYLYSLTLHGIKLGLSNIRALLEAAGNPQDAYPCIHVAGTNGKGSTLAMLGAMLQAAGYRVGRFTSPHLVRLNERFQINGVMIKDGALDDEIERFRAISEQRDYPPTFFELNTAIAFHWFARERVDVALIETGMGGRLDSTNVITPVACAVTNIDLEHTQYLGETVEEIAYEKAGIIKKDVPVVIGETRSSPRSVLLSRARHEGAPASMLERDFTFSLSGPPLDQRISYESATMAIEDAPLALNGAFQGANAAIAIAVAEACAPRFPRLDRAAILSGLAQAKWPCRMECVFRSPPVYIDVAHNPAGAKRLAETFPRCTVLLAVSADKDAAAMLEHLGPIARHFVVTAYDGARALAPAALADLARPYAPVQTAASVAEALRMALPLARADAPLLITGSIYLAGEARRLLIEQHGAPPLGF